MLRMTGLLPIRLSAIAWLLLASTESPARVSFGILSKCQPIAAIREALASPVTCRNARSDVERAFTQKAPQMAPLRYCFFDPPWELLRSFSCLEIEHPAQRQFLCFRLINQADIRHYRANSRLYAQEVNDYLGAASACPVGNGDASIATWSLMPPMLNWIARFSFGFILPVGGDLVGESQVLHGFADLDPAIQANTGVEFFMTDKKQ